jgi:hypothetical protein
MTLHYCILSSTSAIHIIWKVMICQTLRDFTIWILFVLGYKCFLYMFFSETLWWHSFGYLEVAHFLPTACGTMCVYIEKNVMSRILSMMFCTILPIFESTEDKDWYICSVYCSHFSAQRIMTSVFKYYQFHLYDGWKGFLHPVTTSWQ